MYRSFGMGSGHLQARFKGLFVLGRMSATKSLMDDLNTPFALEHSPVRSSGVLTGGL